MGTTLQNVNIFTFMLVNNMSIIKHIRGIIMDYENVLTLASNAGKILLQNGAEIYRVEETITRICECYEVEDANAFVTPSGIFVSFFKDTKTYSKVIRTKEISLNLEKINQVNDLSRNIHAQKLSVKQAKAKLENIELHEGYSPVLKMIASGCIALFFTYFFSGTFIDGLCAFPIGCIVQIIGAKFDAKQINSMVKITMLSSLLTILTLLLVRFQIANMKDSIIMGNLMLLVPGVAITNAIRDSISGDLISGITRGMEACFIAIALALGAGVTISIWMSYLGGI